MENLVASLVFLVILEESINTVRYLWGAEVSIGLMVQLAPIIGNHVVQRLRGRHKLLPESPAFFPVFFYLARPLSLLVRRVR